MPEVFPKDILLRVGGRTMARHGVWAVAGSRRGPVEVPITATRADAATLATLIDRDSTVRYAAANVPRLQWEDLDGDGIRETPGLLLEGSRIQGWQFTEDLTNAIWAKTLCTISANADGTADGIVANAGTGNTNVGQATGALTDSTQQSCFFEVKAGNKTWARVTTVDKSNTSRHSWVNLSTGALGTVNASHTVIVMTVGTYRRIQVMWPSATGATAPFGYICPANADNDPNTTGDGATINIYVRNTQMEVDKAFPSSYIPRTGAGAVTRAADAFTVPFNFGPMDTTILYRFARTVWADAAGDIGFFPEIANLGATGDPNARIESYFGKTTRDFHSRYGTAASDAGANIPAGASLSFISQHKNAGTLPAVAVDVGSGLTAFDTGAPAFTQYFSQTLRVGGPSAASLYGVLLDLAIFRGLFTLAEATAVP